MIEDKKIAEKRESIRIFFTLEEGIGATISSHNENAESIPVTVLSLSTGGTSLMANRYKLPGIKEGERLTLTAAGMPQPLGSIGSIDAVVKYVLDFEHNVRLSLGCEFTGLSEEVEQRIEEFVQIRYKNLGFGN
ncbi:MAG: PilZ domain-containing protein [bacterium]|nr:PilZ domain-containing protein [bacterium]